MKKIALATALLLSLSTAPAVADEAADALQLTIARLQNTVDQQHAKIKMKNTLIACEREQRRTLAQALRTGAPMPKLDSCKG